MSELKISKVNFQFNYLKRSRFFKFFILWEIGDRWEIRSTKDRVAIKVKYQIHDYQSVINNDLKCTQVSQLDYS